ncbi:toprim domain-containing protein [Brevundimonas sp.]|uniref:toprim domain-containing protein n=1 Tax=Brevundimonas sp. TaxID=1871086 RepID=UPI0039185DEC
MAEERTLELVKRRLLGDSERTQAPLVRSRVDEIYLKYGIPDTRSTSSARSWRCASAASRRRRSRPASSCQWRSSSSGCDWHRSAPPTLRRIYLARDGDAAGHTGVEALADRARSTGIKAVVLDASLGDFNDDLRAMGPAALATVLQVQLASEDVTRFLDVGGLSEAVHACYYDCWSDFRSVTARTG